MIEVSKTTFYTITVTLFVFFSIFLINAANAYEVPKDAVIKVFDTNGKQIGEMSRSEYKVVKLGTSKIMHVKTTHYVEKKSKRIFSLTLGGGMGNDGLRVKSYGSRYEIENRQKPIGSFGGCITKDGVGVCLTGQTNSTVLFNFLIPIGSK